MRNSQISNWKQRFVCKDSNNKLKLIEIILLGALLLTLLLSAFWMRGAVQAQTALADRVVRLHVLANSDAREDQALKLRVKDAVFARVETILKNAESRAAAEETLRAALGELTRLAEETLAENGCGDAVSVSLETTDFPTKEYDGFALPAGSYRALRVVIGAGAGQNWWCVVFPPLCGSSCTDTQNAALGAGLTQADWRLITGGDARYVLKFKSAELWNRLLQALGK